MMQQDKWCICFTVSFEAVWKSQPWAALFPVCHMQHGEHLAKITVCKTPWQGKKPGKTAALKTVKNTSEVLKPEDEDSGSELVQKMIKFFFGCLFSWKCYFTKPEYFNRYKFYQHDYKTIGIEKC